MKNYLEMLDKLADVTVQVGLNLQRGQELVITAPIEALPLTRKITERAYQAGAKMVTTLYSDDAATLARYRFAPSDAFDYAPAWLYEGMAEAYAAGAARLAITGQNPALLKGQDPDRISRASKAQSIANRRALELIASFHINWSIVAYATVDWAKMVFPDLPEGQAVEKLWEAIFKASRLDTDDPVAAWAAHNANLHKRVQFLNEKRYAALHFKGPGTDLKVGLADDHVWSGGAAVAKNGVVCNPNIPTEEVFTTPHKDRVEGYVSSSKPLAHQGSLLDGIRVRFEGGRIVEASAKVGEDILKELLETDEGARRLGEVALVPHSSPIAQSGILFYNTLFDENAASHIALGQAYSECIRGGDRLSREELAARGANASLIHVDWMIGSNEIDVDGITHTGQAEPLMRRGEWVS
ncbi:peptidase M29 aminopeptidase II [Allomeiothermus silvanus DSM 9946]|uniref:Peptidase M29 aminopeptidase II n=1 Tax=Allomeiothermus silvanus (strain ATCC 700542 / DSM 9946 / NBRC 106475 / NCIMB 13440 / VI-R2) TaxID=526227 RepID=D7BGN0_ALLS1|nr:peptidase M29 aminopeptidase II [Allomeiothermus silvanus DSM 9946]